MTQEKYAEERTYNLLLETYGEEAADAAMRVAKSATDLPHTDNLEHFSDGRDSARNSYLVDLVFARLEMIEDRPMDERDDHEEAMLRDILEILNRKEPDPVKPFACEHGSRRAACPICSDEREVV